VFDWKERREVAKTRTPNVLVTGLFYCRNGQSLCFGGADGSIRLWDVPIAREVVTFPVARHMVPSVVFDSAGKRAAVACLVDKKVRLFKVPDYGGNTDLDCRVAPFCIAFDPKGTRLAVGDGPEVKIWNVETATCVQTLQGHKGSVLGLVWRPGKDELLSCSRDGTIRIWELDGGASRELFKTGSGPVRTLAMTRDGKIAASGGDDKVIRIWDVRTGGQLKALEGHMHSVCKVAFSPDGRSVCSVDGGIDGVLERTSAGAVIMWDLERGWERWRGKGSFCGLDFSPDGQCVATIGMAFPLGEIKTWDALTGVDFTLYAKTSVPQGVAFSGDWSCLAVGMLDIHEAMLRARSGADERTAVLAIWDARLPSAVPERSGADGQ
jgi:WD40 repeat protein